MIRPSNAQTSVRTSSGFRVLCLSCSIVAGICVLALILPRNHDAFALSYVKYFFPKQSHSKTLSLNSDDAVPWGYSQDDGPEHWGDLSIAYRKCKTGAGQSPIDVKSTESKGQLLTLPTLRWNGFENISSKGPTSFIKGDLGKHGYRIQFVERAPTITTVDFTQYLNILPIPKVKRTTYTLDRILFKTPSENLINGKRRVQ
jgi:carbonic anhydrase